MTFEEFLEEKNLTPENTPGSEHALMQEAYNAGYEAGKKNAIVWHKVDLDNDSDNDGLPAEVGKKYLVLFKDGDICSAEFWRNSSCCFFGAYVWNEIEAWAEMPEVKKC